MFGFIGKAQTDALQHQQERDQHERETRKRDLSHLYGRKGELTAEELDLLAQIDRESHAQNPRLSHRQCVECHRPFVLVLVRGIELDCCPRCRSCWCDAGELSRLTGQSADVPGATLGHRASKHACPVCAAPMWECTFRKPFNLTVDRCPKGHGVYLEEGKLVRALRIT